MSTEALPSGPPAIQQPMRWPYRLLIWLLVWLVLVLLGNLLNQAIEVRRHKQRQSPQAQRDEWRRVHQHGLALARLLKFGPIRSAREADQLLDHHGAQQGLLYTPAALQLAGQDANDLLEIAELLRQAERYEAEQARELSEAPRADERWRLAERGQAQPARPASPNAISLNHLVAAASAVSRGTAPKQPDERWFNPRGAAWANGLFAQRYRQQAMRAMNRIAYRYPEP